MNGLGGRRARRGEKGEGRRGNQTNPPCRRGGTTALGGGLRERGQARRGRSMPPARRAPGRAASSGPPGPASADLEAQPAAGSRRGHAGPSVSAAGRGGHAPATADVPRADSPVPPGPRGGSPRPRPRAHPAGPPPAVAAHARPPPPRPDGPSRPGSGGRGYEPGTGEHPPPSASGGGRTPPCASSPQHRAAPRSAAARPRPAHSAPLPRPAATPPRPRVRSCASRLPIGCAMAIGRGPASEARARGTGAEEGALPASFVTSRGSDNPFHLARPAYWLHACARSRGHALLLVQVGLRAPPPR